jgi:hypothetical protein
LVVANLSYSLPCAVAGALNGRSGWRRGRMECSGSMASIGDGADAEDDRDGSTKSSSTLYLAGSWLFGRANGMVAVRRSVACTHGA